MFKLEEWLNDRGGRICKHRIAWDLPRPTSQWNMALDARPENGWPPSISLPTFLAGVQRDAILSCPLCPTDAEIEIKWCGARKQWSVEVKTWRQFGTCRSPSDPRWESMTWTYLPGPPWKRRAEEHPPGAIRYRWSKADKKPVAMVGCFLDPTSDRYPNRRS
ncbi:hypothetical protein Ct61P_10528 [Colletotrichum tofieldiae]|nr:hypothetical protein Ct61P_10528 [Colletotrichum tofieldiae]